MNLMHVVTTFAVVLAAVGCSSQADEEVGSDHAEIVQLGSGVTPNVTCNPREARACGSSGLTCLPTSTDRNVGACCDADLGECSVISSAGRPMCLGNGAILGDLRCKDGSLTKKETALCGNGGPGCYDGACVSASTEGHGVCCPRGWCATIEDGQGTCFGPGAEAPDHSQRRCSFGMWR